MLWRQGRKVPPEPESCRPRASRVGLSVVGTTLALKRTVCVGLRVDPNTAVCRTRQLAIGAALLGIVDGSASLGMVRAQCGREVLDHALTLAERFGAHLHVLYVRHETRPATLDEVARDEAEFEAEHESIRQTALSRLRQGHTLPADHIHPEVRTGPVLECILGAADDVATDLIVMGTHGRQGVGDTLFGSTTERVLVKARQALLVVREPTDADEELSAPVS
jgi:nucleotide-binding universal stress UspA family protein